MGMATLTYKFEVELGGVWTDITSDVRANPACVITRGYSDQSDKPKPQTAKFTLDNRNQQYNPRYAPGPHYGKLIRNTPVRISARAGAGAWQYRFYGFIAAWQPLCNADGKNRRVPIEASGVLRRLEVSATRPRSAFRQFMNQHSGAPVVTNYWPLEDTAVGGQHAPDIGDANAVLIESVVAVDKFPGRRGEIAPWAPDGTLLIPGSQLFCRVDMRNQFAGSWEAGFMVRFTDEDSQLTVEYESSAGVITMVVDPAANTWDITWPDKTTSGNSIAAKGLLNRAMYFLLRQTVNGTGTTGYILRSAFGGIATSNPSANAPIGGGTFRTSDLRSINFTSSGTSDEPVVLGSVWSALGQSTNTGMNTYAAPAGGYRVQSVERLGTRWDRLAIESNVDVAFMGATGPQLGTQIDQTFLEHAVELANTCAGMLVEDRDSAELRLLPVYSMNYTSPTTVIPLGEVFPELEQVEDDRFTRNDITVKNVDGNDQRATKETGTLSVSEVGLYEQDHDANLRALFSEGADLAAFLLGIGTWPGPRFPSVLRTISKLSDSDAGATMNNLSDPGVKLQLTELADLIGIHDPVDLMVIGYTETFSTGGNGPHTIEYNTVPADPYRQLTGSVAMRLDAASSVLAADATSTAGTISVASVNELCSGAEQPYDIVVGGERMTVTGVIGASSPQTFTVTRSVNGVVKAQTTGAAVRLYRPYYLRPKIGT